jgi:hypothetical protein
MNWPSLAGVVDTPFLDDLHIGIQILHLAILPRP